MGCGCCGANVQPEPWADAGLTKVHYDQIVQKFAKLDANGDRKISRTEFENANVLPEFLGMEQADKDHLFNRIDLDKTGEINFDEFLKYMGSRKDHLSLPTQVQPEKDRLEKNMKQLGFQLSKTDREDGIKLGVPGDGNCQFYSLSWKLYSTISKGSSVRQAIVEHLSGPAGQDLAAFYAPEHRCQPATWKDYLRVMAQDRTWGDQFTLQAAADIFNTRIHVLTSSRYNAKAAPQAGQVGGRQYGAVQVLEPASTSGAKPKDIWIAFAAKHYSPIDSSRRTPKALLKG